MTEHQQPGQPVRHTGYERTDLTARGVLIFMGALALGTILVVFVLEGLYGFLNHGAQESQPPMSPLVTNAPQDTRNVPGSTPKEQKEYFEKAFPDPRLETDERGQLHDIIAPQDKLLGSYGYVDEKAGVVRIPIDRAMDLIAQRGLPTRSQQSSAQPSAAEQSNAAKDKPTKAAAPAKAKGKKK